VLSCQAPRRAVRTPWLFNATAMAPNVVAPEACIWRTTGSTLAAKASAFSRFASLVRPWLGRRAGWSGSPISRCASGMRARRAEGSHRLIRLDLSGNDIGNEGAQALKELTALTTRSRSSVARSLGLTYRHASMFRMPPLNLICRPLGIL
jgi:hypothetical protein